MAKDTTVLGKAFEYACLLAIYNALKDNQPIAIETSPQFDTAKSFYNSLKEGKQKKDLDCASKGAVKILMGLEPQLVYPAKNKPLTLSIQADAEGMKGDVRDVLCIRYQNDWQIGLSCKHNHSAVKHSRLSKTIDFGKEWFGIPCSQKYFSAITPLFEELETIRDNSAKTARWDSIEDKAERYYIPILTAFMEELKRLAKGNKDVPMLLISYLIGKYDFYKVITNDTHRLVRVEAINLNGTLNKPADGHKAVATIPRLKYPTCFYHIGFKDGSNNTITVVCDGGWEISMRIHNASSRVEPSLKFDVQLISTPNTIYTQSEPYED